MLGADCQIAVQMTLSQPQPIAYCLNLILISMLLIPLYSIPVKAAEGKESQTTILKGRVERIESGQAPALPGGVLQGIMDGKGLQAGATVSGLTGGVSQSQTLPPELRGSWDGSVKITQMETYPDQHEDAYSHQFIEEIHKFFKLGKTGRITLKFSPNPDGKITLDSTDVYFFRGLKLKLTDSAGPALVPGGYNLPRLVENDVTRLGPERVEQTRIDHIRIVDRQRRLLHTGFTEVSALYQLKSERRMKVKILNIDYSHNGRPLWKCLMEGEARRWSKK